MRVRRKKKVQTDAPGPGINLKYASPRRLGEVTSSDLRDYEQDRLAADPGGTNWFSSGPGCWLYKLQTIANTIARIPGIATKSFMSIQVKYALFCLYIGKLSISTHILSTLSLRWLEYTSRTMSRLSPPALTLNRIQDANPGPSSNSLYSGLHVCCCPFPKFTSS